MKKLILGMVLGLTVISAASTKAEAKTYKVTSSNTSKVEKEVAALIKSKVAEKKNQILTIKLVGKGKKAEDNVLEVEYRAGRRVDIDKFCTPNKKWAFELYDPQIKSGKTKKLGQYVKATVKYSKKKYTVTYKITIKDSIIDKDERKAEYKNKAIAEIKALVKEDSDIAKVHAFFQFCQNKRNLSGTSYSEWEKFYKAPYKYSQDRDHHKNSSCYAEALKAFGFETKTGFEPADSYLTVYAAVKFRGTWYTILSDSQMLGRGAFGDHIQFYSYNSKLHAAMANGGSDPLSDRVYNEVEQFDNSEELSEFVIALSKKDLPSDKYAQTIIETFTKRFPMLQMKSDWDKVSLSINDLFTFESLALYDYYCVGNEDGTGWVNLYFNQYETEIFLN